MPGRPVDSVDRLCDVCERLHGVLAEHGMLGRRWKRRAGLLRTLFSLIDLNSAQLNLQLAKLCLAVSRMCACVFVSVSVCDMNSTSHLPIIALVIGVRSMKSGPCISISSCVSVETTC